MTTAAFDIETLTTEQEQKLIEAVSRYEMLRGCHIVYKLRFIEETEGGIFLPDIVRDRPVENMKSIQARVVNAAEFGLDRKPSHIKVGDAVVYNSYNCGKIVVSIDGEAIQLPVIRETDIEFVIGN